MFKGLDMFNLKFSKNTKDIQWSFISLAIASFANLLLRIVLGKKLGPSGLGLYISSSPSICLACNLQDLALVHP